jgi:hypothetical protein
MIIEITDLVLHYCKGTSVHSLTSPASNPFQSCLYVFPMVSVHIWHPYNSNLSDIWWFCWLHCN